MFSLKNEGMVWLSPSSPTMSLVGPVFLLKLEVCPCWLKCNWGQTLSALLPVQTASSSWAAEPSIRRVSMLNSAPGGSMALFHLSRNDPLLYLPSPYIRRTKFGWQRLSQLQPSATSQTSSHSIRPSSCVWVVQDMVSVVRSFSARLQGSPWPPIQTKPYQRVATHLIGHAKLVIWMVGWKMDSGASGCLPLSPLSPTSLSSHNQSMHLCVPVTFKQASWLTSCK